MDLPLGEKDETQAAETTPAASEQAQADASEAAEKEKEGVTHGV
jgi:hypothetical protein